MRIARVLVCQPPPDTKNRWSPIVTSGLEAFGFFERAGDRTRTGDVQLGKLAFYQLNYARETSDDANLSSNKEPQVGIEPTTARLRIECSTTELLWRILPLSCSPHALERTRTATPCGTTPSRWRVYQFHHQGIVLCDALLFQSAILLYQRGRRGSNPRPLE